jgi:hypothetical protein
LFKDYLEMLAEEGREFLIYGVSRLTQEQTKALTADERAQRNKTRQEYCKLTDSHWGEERWMRTPDFYRKCQQQLEMLEKWEAGEIEKPPEKINGHFNMFHPDIIEKDKVMQSFNKPVRDEYIWWRNNNA